MPAPAPEPVSLIHVLFLDQAMLTLKCTQWVSLGGNAPLSFIDPTVGDGFTAIRYLSRSATDASLNGANWAEPGNKLSSARWYATAQTMPDSSVFVASGSLNGLDPTVLANNNPTYEILNADGFSSGESIPLAILEKNQPYYMYPFVHLLNDGNLFIFVSKSAEIFDVAGNQTVTTLPDLEGEFRTYPNTGSYFSRPLCLCSSQLRAPKTCLGTPVLPLKP